MNKKYFIIIFAAVFILLSFLCYEIAVAPGARNYTEIKELRINGKVIKVEIADTVEKQEKGLSARQALLEDQGMLFVFRVPDHYYFWMKDMKFALDLVWIDQDKIVEVSRNIKPEDYQPPKSLTSKDKIDKVLEINAGAAEKFGIKEGDKVEF